MAEGPRACDRCRRPAARRRALYGRARGAESAILAGRFGRKCFYEVAAQLDAVNVQPEREDARVIYLRGRK